MELLSQQRAIADKGGRALAFGFTVLAAFAAYGVAGKGKGHELLLRALPAALALIGMELLQNFATEGAMASARGAIENALKDHVGAPVLVYDSYIRSIREADYSAAAVGAVFFVLYLCVAGLTQVPGAPVGRAAISGGEVIVWVARAATVVTFVGLVVVAWGVLSQRKAVERKLEAQPIDLSSISHRS